MREGRHGSEIITIKSTIKKKLAELQKKRSGKELIELPSAFRQ
jgi:hypothetical protein